MKAADLIGKQFGRLTVIARAPNNKHGNTMWHCRCDCGNTSIVRGDHLTSGRIQSCGCYCKERASETHLSNLTGKTFGRLTVLGLSDTRAPGGQIQWKCQCSCPNKTIIDVITDNLTRGNTQSCGCLQRERTSEARLKWRTPEEQKLSDVYQGMKQRCYDSNHPGYEGWGGRGIYICDEWLNPINGKDNFIRWALSNGFIPGLSIDRVDNDGPYAPWNCRWVGDQVQANNKRDNLYIDIGGEVKTLAEWSEITGFNYDRLKYRYHKQPDEVKLLIFELLNNPNPRERSALSEHAI